MDRHDEMVTGNQLQMSGRNGQPLEVGMSHLLLKETLEWAADGELSTAYLDGNFPGACDADQFLCLGVADEVSGGHAEPRIVPPES